MEFPITRERLQNYISSGEALRAEKKQRVSEVMKTICKEVEKLCLTTKTQLYIYKVSMQNQKDILDDILKAIKDFFPGCGVGIDPLKTYIAINWSLVDLDSKPTPNPNPNPDAKPQSTDAAQ